MTTTSVNGIAICGEHFLGTGAPRSNVYQA
jgi:hypothetical protein